MKKFVILFSLFTLTIAQDRMATVSGNCFLQNQTDHSGAMVLFEALSPSAVTDSVFTSEVGSYEIGLSEGIYAVHFSKDDFYPYTLPETPTFATDSYTIEDVELIDGGSLLMVSGDVSGEWTSDVLYLVEGDIQVTQGETLMIHAGTTVKFMENFSFYVYGDLYVMGEEGNMVTFTSGQPMANSGDWQGIYLYDNTYYEGSCDNFNEAVECVEAGCSWDNWEGGYCYGEGGMPVDGTIVIQHATIEYGQYGLYAEQTYDNNITILNSTIQHSSNYGIYAYYSDIVISGNSINDNNSYGIYVYRCSPIISGNSINDNNSRGIYVESIQFSIPGPVITTNSIENNSNQGIYFQSVDNITITGNTIRGNSSHGIYGSGCYSCQDEHTITITENLIEDNQGNGMDFYSIYNADISNNVVRDNNTYGVYLNYIYNSTVSHNTINGNDSYGMYTRYGDNSKVMHNIITGNEGYGVRIRYWNGGLDFSYNNIWDNNNGNFYPSDDSPPELGNMITTNANGTDCDTYNNISENPLFVNPPIEVNEWNLGWSTNEDSTVTYQMIVPEWYDGYDNWYFTNSRDETYYQDSWWNSNSWGNYQNYYPDSDSLQAGEYFYFDYSIYESEFSTDSSSFSLDSLTLNWDGNIQVPEVENAIYDLITEELQSYSYIGSLELYSSSDGYYPDDNDTTNYYEAYIYLYLYGIREECYLNDYNYTNWQEMENIVGSFYEITVPLLAESIIEDNCIDSTYTEYSLPEQIYFSPYYCDDSDWCDVYHNPSINLDSLANNPLPSTYLDPPDFNLLENSPCIDAGSSAEEYYDPDGTIADMGAFPFFQGTPLPPEIDFSASTTDGTAPLPVQFAHLNTGGPITTYSWNFGDDATSSVANPVHTYMSDEAESFSVSLTVEGPGGADVIEYIDLISVIPITFPPVSNFTANTQVSFGDVEFTAQANGQVDSYSWDFGDENTSSDQNPLHSYSEAGTYSVSLTVSGPTGSDTETKTDYIQILSPETVIAGFELASSSGITPFTAMFTNISMGSIEGYQWNFGDGDSSEDQNPTHTYTEPGSYMATLIVTGMINSDTTSQEITALSAAPMITSISDVPNDQGGRVYVSFAGSGYDTNTPNRNEQYAVERQDNDIWVNVGSGPAYGESSYIFEVTTLSDSTSSGNAASNFRIIASMDEGIWISEASSGYSIDNLAPSVPSEFAAQYENGSVNLSWSANTETDLGYYNLYRDGELLTSVNANSYFDDTVMMGQSYEYSLTAVDIHDNESELTQSVAVETLLMGDINFDATINVQDVILIINMILPNGTEFTDEQLAAADINGDGAINIQDIVLVINIILGDDLARGESISNAVLEYGNGQFKIQTDGLVAGIELRLSGVYSMTKTYLPEGWEFHSKDHTMLMYNMGGDNLSSELLFEYQGELSVESNIIADWFGNGISAQIIQLPEEFALVSAYPNPFNPVTTINYALPIETNLSIAIYNMQGRRVELLVNEKVDAGLHSVFWNADEYSSGVYFVKMIAGDYVNTQKLMLVK